MSKRHKIAIAAFASAAAAAAYAATVLSFDVPVNVSNTPTPTEKAKDVRLAYKDGTEFVKPWLYTYGDGPLDGGSPGRQNVYAKTSFDGGKTWSDPILLSRDANGDPTGGQSVTTKDGITFLADNNKPNIYAPPTTDGPKVVITWTSAYCPDDPTAANSGSYASTVQGTADINGDNVLDTTDQPFYCMWVATTTDPKLAAWDVVQLRNGLRDAIGDIPSGNATGTGFAIAWQEDPQGLQPGEAEGPGDGGSGAVVTGGTNIWYTHSATPNGLTFRQNIAQLSDNNEVGVGKPGASRPNLQLSGNTAVVAYEETACAGGTGGRCIVYHSFPYSGHDTDSPGTVLSDPAKNARRVRFTLQGATAAGSSALRAVVFWRESGTTTPGAPADIVMRRGLAGASAGGSSGFLPADILVDPPQKLTDISAAGGNANAHRASIRGSTVLLAYNKTPNMDAANPEKTSTPTANYNLHLTRSTADGAPGTWSEPVNMSRITDVSVNSVEPRLVPTPGTITNPITGTPDPGDTQNTSVFFLAFATEANTLAKQSGRVHVARSVDGGATFDAFVPISAVTSGQSETQLRPTPDGSSVGALWMEEQTPGDATTKDTMFATAVPITVPDPVPPQPPVPPADDDGGCTMNPNARFDAGLLGLLAAAIGGLALRRRREGKRA